MQEMIKPLSGAMAKGDAFLKVQSLWDKTNIKRVEASSAAWTANDDLGKFTGMCVTANASGQYAVPKSVRDGDEQKWIAVVQDSADLLRKAEEAKAQGASGLVVRCQDAVSLQRLAKGKP